MLRRTFAALLLALATVLGLSVATAPASAATPVTTAAPASAAPEPFGATVLIGTGGITWTDVSAKGTPNLWQLLRDGSSAAMSIRSVDTNTCPLDGWLGVSAANRAAAPRAGTGPVQQRPCDPIEEPAGGVIPRWEEYQKAAASRQFDAKLGLLGEAAAKSDTCIKPVGPGAAIAAAMPEGTADRYSPYSDETLLVDLNTCPVTIVDVGSVRDPADVAAGETVEGGSRTEQIAAIDKRIGDVINAAPGGADFIVASLSDAGVTERLRLAVARGPNFGSGRLNAQSTRQPGLVQAQDVPATLMAITGIEPPTGLGGTRMTFDPAPDNSEARAEDRLQALVDYDLASHEVHSLVPPFFNTFAYGQLVIYLLVFLVWKGKIGGPDTRRKVLGIVRVVAVAAASVPASTFLANLIPWWRFPIPMISIVGAVGIFVAAIAYAALRGPWARSALGPLAFVAGVTVAVLAGDVITGSRLQLSSLMGLQPVVAGRFYGMGNVTFALFATSSILLATAVSSYLVRAGRDRIAALAVIVIAVGTVIVDGAPFWGADGGGPPAYIPGITYLILSILGIRMTWQRVGLIGLGSVGLFFVVALLDFLRAPDNRSHLGRFIQAIIDGNALDIVVRKGQQNISILLGNAPLTLLVPAALLFVIYVLARPTSWGSKGLAKSFEKAPTLRAGLIALVITLTIGFLINDSGTAIPAVGATVAVPLIVSVVVRNLEEDLRSVAGTRRARRA
ncbi:hypothetical protein N802_04485 [Knoellia sinensis KCTC 19936]|uniref:Uncharacterized protein n=1 Tax=Knoellia sinensis KCTC 19936 TaxID=1385520 RepID=A0A0A0J2J2_9MICO|nr:hypothetical protein [Knoellia sinensis]KGN31353.1 hypothetical protein N802_04485 [Knoellia sinensis KCTC 19936]